MPGFFVFPVGLSAGVRSCTPLSGPESFHDRGNFSRAPSAGAEEGGCLTADGAGGASRPCPWRGLYRVSPAFVELFGADGVFFTLRGKFLPMERGKGDGRGERHSPDACDDVTARTRSGRAAYASVTEIVSGRKKSPLSTTAGRGADRRGRMHRQRPMQGGRERRFRAPQRTGIRKMSVRCTLGCCGHSQLCSFL